MKLNLGKMFVKMRTCNGESQKDIAEILCVSRSTYSTWENDIGEMPFSKLLVFLNHYSLSLEDFMELVNTQENSTGGNQIGQIIKDLASIKADLEMIKSRL